MSTKTASKTAPAKKPAAAKKAPAKKKDNVKTDTATAPAAATDKPAEGAPGAPLETQAQPPAVVAKAKEPKAPPTQEVLKLADIKASAKTQVRVKLDEEALETYTEAAKGWKDKGADSEFPNLVVFKETITKEGKEPVINYWLGDGFTRRAALKAAGFTEHKCDVYEGTMQDAFLYGCNINAMHGAKLTNKDKKNALLLALEDKALCELSNNALADLIGFSESFVRSHRPKNKTPGEVTVAGKGGKARKVKTKNIGKKGAGKKAATAAAATPPAGAGDAGAGDTTAQGATATGDAGTGTPAAGAATSGAGQNADEKQAAAGKQDDETERKLGKIVGFLNELRPGYGDTVRKAIDTGARPMSPRDIRFWSETSKERIQKAAPLVMENGWTPKQAFAFLDRVPDATTKLDHLINLAVVGQGIAVEKIDGYRIIIVDEAKFDVTRNMQLGTHRIAPKGAAPEELPEDTAPAPQEAGRVVELDEINGGEQEGASGKPGDDAPPAEIAE